jgi:apolipoprotein D and lipocalin family protein
MEGNSMNSAAVRLSVVSSLLAVLAVASGCSTANPPAVAENVDLTRYAGKWYEIAKYPVIFQRGLVAVTADYTLRDDGKVTVFNRGLKNSFDGKESTISGVAAPADITSNAKLKLRFDPFPVSLFKADYWIIELGADYEYAVVSNPSKKYLWILSRTPHMDQPVYDGIVARLNAQGFETDKLELTPQP